MQCNEMIPNWIWAALAIFGGAGEGKVAYAHHAIAMVVDKLLLRAIFFFLACLKFASLSNSVSDWWWSLTMQWHCSWHGFIHTKLPARQPEPRRTIMTWEWEMPEQTIWIFVERKLTTSQGFHRQYSLILIWLKTDIVCADFGWAAAANA